MSGYFSQTSVQVSTSSLFFGELRYSRRAAFPPKPAEGSLSHESGLHAGREKWEKAAEEGRSRRGKKSFRESGLCFCCFQGRRGVKAEFSWGSISLEKHFPTCYNSCLRGGNNSCQADTPGHWYKRSKLQSLGCFTAHGSCLLWLCLKLDFDLHPNVCCL